MITIQQELLEDGRLPYPFHIVSDGEDVGKVDNQDLWNGDPYRLAGFQLHPDFQEVNLQMADFLKTPQAAVGMYPVFIRKDGSMYGMTVAIKSVTE